MKLAAALALALAASSAIAADTPWSEGLYRGGPAYASFPASHARACAAECAGEARCKAFNFVEPAFTGEAMGLCELKAEAIEAVASDCCSAGAKVFVAAAPPPPVPRAEDKTAQLAAAPQIVPQIAKEPKPAAKAAPKTPAPAPAAAKAAADAEADSAARIALDAIGAPLIRTPGGAPAPRPRPAIAEDPAAPVLAAADILLVETAAPSASYRIAQDERVPRYSVQRQHGPLEDPTPGQGPVPLLER